MFNLPALVDSGANSNFISKDYVDRRQLELKRLDKPCSAVLADGSSVEIKNCLPNVKVTVTCNGQSKDCIIDLLVNSGLKYGLVLGIPWLQKVNRIIKS